MDGDRQEGLEAYRHEKLELGDSLLALMRLVEADHDEERTEYVRQLAARLAEDKFQLAVVGQFSRGKSTLMNAILGDSHLPVGALPMTSVITTVVYGSTARATVRRAGTRLALEMPIGDLVRYVGQASAEREELRVVSALVEVPAEILRLGFSFVDTPGVGSAIAGNTETTLGFLPEADAVIFVTSFESALGEAELAFLGTVRSHVRRIFIVLNKKDLVAGGEAGDIVAFVHRQLRAAGLDGARVFEVSARDGLAARLAGDAAALAGSGLPALEAELVDYLTTAKAGEFLLRVTEHAERVVAMLAGEAELSLALGTESEEAREAMLRTLAGRLEGERQSLLDEIAGSVARRLEVIETSELPQWRLGLSDLASTVTAGGELRSAAEDLRSLAPQVTAWSAGEASAYMTALEAEQRPSLTELARLGSGLAGADAPTDWPHFVPSPPDWTVPPPARRHAVSSQRAQGLLGDFVKEAVEGHLSRFGESVKQDAARWLGVLENWSAAKLSAAGDKLRERLVAAASPEFGIELEGLAAMLAGVRARVESWSTAAPGSGTSTNPSQTQSWTQTQPASTPVRLGGCAVCGALATALFDFMAEYQYELWKRVGRRAAHEATGGFCAAHTWYYAEIGSPIGTSAAYAGIAEAKARALVAGAVEAADVPALARVLSELQPSESRCPACERLAVVEQEVVEELAGRLGRDATDGTPAPPGDAPLCIEHAERLLASGRLGLGAARDVVRAVAALLQRRSEDMRTFALKRQSLQGRLVDKEEERAHRDVLLRLAGDPMLARVPRRDAGL
ncbi:MAG: dynamin family protein [Acidimicrobiales bacterium]